MRKRVASQLMSLLDKCRQVIRKKYLTAGCLLAYKAERRVVRPGRPKRCRMAPPVSKADRGKSSNVNEIKGRCELIQRVF